MQVAIRGQDFGLTISSKILKRQSHPSLQANGCLGASGSGWTQYTRGIGDSAGDYFNLSTAGAEVIFIEEDLEVSPDFFSCPLENYMSSELIGLQWEKGCLGYQKLGSISMKVLKSPNHFSTCARIRWACFF